MTPVSFGSSPFMDGNTPWALSITSSKLGDSKGYGVYLRVGEYRAVCVTPDNRQPALLDLATARDVKSCVEHTLTMASTTRQPVPGETVGSDSKTFIYLMIPAPQGDSYQFVVIDSDVQKPKARLFSSRKGALGVLGNIIDILAGGSVDWTQMAIPSEPQCSH